MKPRYQKVLSDLWSSRARSLLVVASIAVGLFAIGIITTLYSVIAADMRSGYVAVNPANIYIQSTRFDQTMVDTLRRVEGVKQAEGIRVVDTRVRDRKGDWASIRLQAAADWATMPLNRVIYKQGAWPPGKDEVVLDQYKMPDLGVGLGDSIRVELPDGKIRELKVVGVVQDLTIGAFSMGGGFFNAPVMGYITQDTLKRLDQPQTGHYSGLYASIEGDGNDLTAVDAVAARLIQQMKDGDLEVLSSKTIRAGDHPNGYLIDAIVGVLFVLGLLVVFLSGFLITSTLQSLLGQQVQQIGIMKSVGARWMQVAGIYMMLIFIFGLIAFALAAPLAGQISFFLLSLLASKLNFVLQGQRLVLPALILQALLALVMPQVAAWLPIWKGTRISVQEALSGPTGGGGSHHSAHHSHPNSHSHSQKSCGQSAPNERERPAGAGSRCGSPSARAAAALAAHADLHPQHLPPPGPPGADPADADSGRGDLYRHLQRAGLDGQIYRPDQPVLHLGCQRVARPALPHRPDREAAGGSARGGARGRLGHSARRAAPGG